jgi:DNA-binding transcriptional MerR regulator
MNIGEVARRVGRPAVGDSLLRKHGLMPRPPRTSGRRAYDDTARVRRTRDPRAH